MLKIKKILKKCFRANKQLDKSIEIIIISQELHEGWTAQVFYLSHIQFTVHNEMICSTWLGSWGERAGL